MAWRYHGRARVDPNSPEAGGICDRCSFKFSLRDLHYQMEWRGTQLKNIRLRVCPRCLDVPYIFNRAQVLPPDPIPVADPRPQNFMIANSGGGLSPEVLTYPAILDDDGNPVLDDDGNPLVAEGPALHPAGCFTLPTASQPRPQPLPWPINPIGPPVPCPSYLLADNGDVLYDDNGFPIVADNSHPQPPPIPVFVTPPLPPLPQEIGWTYSEP